MGGWLVSRVINQLTNNLLLGRLELSTSLSLQKACYYDSLSPPLQDCWHTTTRSTEMLIQQLVLFILVDHLQDVISWFPVTLLWTSRINTKTVGGGNKAPYEQTIVPQNRTQLGLMDWYTESASSRNPMQV